MGMWASCAIFLPSMRTFNISGLSRAPLQPEHGLLVKNFANLFSLLSSSFSSYRLCSHGRSPSQYVLYSRVLYFVEKTASRAMLSFPFIINFLCFVESLWYGSSTEKFSISASCSSNPR